ncbi:MAG: acetyl-CoA carboxylase, carboxyltransferase subunit beta [Acidobacteria bacterium]|nr:acetyl-CoA carboxylase, carboxyltransferase subunit beta [Acidobacteriota bacterium]MCW5966877.1 acetyl-CoA carboxylase, carboxyltransferase subunit beta [Blastocatellales bacterium]
MAWFTRKEEKIGEPAPPEQRTVKTEGIFAKCENEDCGTTIYRKDLRANLSVCPQCGYHFRLSARDRLAMLFDNGEYEERDAGVAPTDPLGFVDKSPYRDRLIKSQRETGLLDAIIVGEGRLMGRSIVIAAMEFKFIGGSMGSVVGEKITRAIEHCIDERLPLVIVSCSGGARMQEGVLSLMQMAKISAALARLDDARLPFISLLTNPTTGGVTASFAMLGDLNIAEPGAIIGFAGARVIEQTIRQKLPKGFQRSEFLLEHGMLDAVVDRRELREFIASALLFTGPDP